MSEQVIETTDYSYLGPATTHRLYCTFSTTEANVTLHEILVLLHSWRRWVARFSILYSNNAIRSEIADFIHGLYYPPGHINRFPNAGYSCRTKLFHYQSPLHASIYYGISSSAGTVSETVTVMGGSCLGYRWIDLGLSRNIEHIGYVRTISWR